MNQISYWYKCQSQPEKKTFRDEIIKEVGCSEETFYNYLKFESPNLVKILIASKTGIAIQELYKSVNP